MVTHLKFSQCKVDQAVFYLWRGKNFVIVLVHVDDCTVIAMTLPLIDGFKTTASKYVKITDFGELHWILGIKVCHTWENKHIFLSQHSYIESTSWWYGLDDLNLHPCLWTLMPDSPLPSLPLPLKKLPRCTTFLIAKLLAHSCMPLLVLILISPMLYRPYLTSQ